LEIWRLACLSIEAPQASLPYLWNDTVSYSN